MKKCIADCFNINYPVQFSYKYKSTNFLFCYITGITVQSQDFSIIIILTNSTAIKYKSQLKSIGSAASFERTLIKFRNSLIIHHSKLKIQALLRLDLFPQPCHNIVLLNECPTKKKKSLITNSLHFTTNNKILPVPFPSPFHHNNDNLLILTVLQHTLEQLIYSNTSLHGHSCCFVPLHTPFQPKMSIKQTTLQIDFLYMNCKRTQHTNTRCMHLCHIEVSQQITRFRCQTEMIPTYKCPSTQPCSAARKTICKSITILGCFLKIIISSLYIDWYTSTTFLTNQNLQFHYYNLDCPSPPLTLYVWLQQNNGILMPIEPIHYHQLQP
ncbi:hypothetical protein AGLY_011427 [Aphis glycines]|uniref:Uncharacterized protein n=1 Tax=Aphis glycines TaxID=307491 RepID=A0A6G0TEB2_APHGL|nr:hypothetical protein AGLY_011427 [Aphis glycines]